MPWGWEVFAVEVDGAFSGVVIGPASTVMSNTFGTTRLSVQGNVKSKEMRIYILGATGSAGCTLVGTIS
jgi:hypothetical protein